MILTVNVGLSCVASGHGVCNRFGSVYHKQRPLFGVSDVAENLATGLVSAPCPLTKDEAINAF